MEPGAILRGVGAAPDVVQAQAEPIRRPPLQQGHTAVVVHDGRAAIDEVRSRTPDLVVLDLTLPRIEGFGVCRAGIRPLTRTEPGRWPDVEEPSRRTASPGIGAVFTILLPLGREPDGSR